MQEYSLWGTHIPACDPNPINSILEHHQGSESPSDLLAAFAPDFPAFVFPCQFEGLADPILVSVRSVALQKFGPGMSGFRGVRFQALNRHPDELWSSQAFSTPLAPSSDINPARGDELFGILALTSPERLRLKTEEKVLGLSHSCG